jgi:hypothetical membrane protein
MRAWVPVSAGVAPVALIGGWTVAAGLQPAAYDPVRDTISALAAHGAEDRWLMTAALAVLGGCHLLTAVGLTEARPLGRLVLGAGGATTVLVAVLAQPSTLHLPVATASFVALTVWPVASGLPTRRAGALATAALGTGLAWLGVELGHRDLLGLSERVVAGAQAVWPLAVVVVVRRGTRRGTRRGVRRS